MQERYLGDIHDFKKFIFLKFLSIEFNKQIGLNWYLVDPKFISIKEKKNNDGEHRKYIQDEKFKNIDEKVFEELKKFKPKELRKIDKFTEETHLKKFIKFFNDKINIQYRKDWLKRSLKFFDKEEIIFLDPDNGLLKSKVSRKHSLKYILIDEIKSYINSSKIVIYTQFQSFNKHHLLYLCEIKKYLEENELILNIPVVRNRTAPNTFYITICKNKKMVEALKVKIEKFCSIKQNSCELVTI